MLSYVVIGGIALALILKDIYEKYSSRFQLELVAGAGGLQKTMNWVYVAEDYNVSNFLRGGELVITTGVTSSGNPSWLLQFLHHMAYQHTCGLILNIGRYIPREILTPEVIEFCDQQQYPLFFMPWHIHIYYITRVLYERIFLDTRRDEKISIALQQLLTSPDPSPTAITDLKNARFPIDTSYYLALLYPLKTGKHKQFDEHTFNRIKMLLLNQPHHSTLISMTNMICIIAQCETTAEIKDIAKNVLEWVPDCFVGIGSRANGLAQLYQSCQHAVETLRLGLKTQQPVSCYENTGIFRLLMAVPDKQLLQAYSEGYLKPIKEYDRLHNSNLSDTLYQYILHNGKIQAVAEATFCHRNTVNNRIRILKEDLGYRLESNTERLELMCAFLVEQYFESRKDPY